MNSREIRRASLVALGVSAALAASSAWAQNAGESPKDTQGDSGEEMGVITVTGSRTITDNALSPTPLTTVDTAELAKTTPSDTADALNKLPSILGGRTPRTQGNGSTNNGGNTLSLRNFGATRTLVLMNGHRIAPSNQDGSVNIDVLPQMMVERVDIVTGGASAAYGSDAVAGVVNFIMKQNFQGVQGDVNYSWYSHSQNGQGNIVSALNAAGISVPGDFGNKGDQTDVKLSAPPDCRSARTPQCHAAREKDHQGHCGHEVRDQEDGAHERRHQGLVGIAAGQDEIGRRDHRQQQRDHCDFEPGE